MNAHSFTFGEHRLTALPSGALWWADRQLLCVSDLHLGKSDRIARRSGVMLPPYETQETLAKLSHDIAVTDPKTVLCLGDSFDDLMAADSLSDADDTTLTSLQAGRQWLWLEGNHDPGPLALGGTHLSIHQDGGLTFRHIASDTQLEISGHYHPKYAIPGAGNARSCFLTDAKRLILPAYGAYTGGLRATDPVLTRLFSGSVIAILTGHRAICVPVKPSAHPARPNRLRGSRP
ncbi:MAG: DNA ligase-associated metallophosphoesterase [Loktanella salsilacus]|jgi:DNA ligase-associated metallophosphoesterase|uniref:ligase-associated DNA damage response endonuclease PdeM n=1 Tax=Loktanella salsilacus TaxID=195913 RepID=UPI0020B66A4E|nr:ligase-associated DNA damage response endonuclease PdeM [Loktanella salsilacus]UTH44002.1 ligase-associated DNA damage response endonuclease PdeM [Loktanella salsilacus]UTH47713.1 ligase-associated DNA damage response endonuclease PdeM [Loktanella salsilacus]